jgi:hypothetical protein
MVHWLEKEKKRKEKALNKKAQSNVFKSGPAGLGYLWFAGDCRCQRFIM